ncbi:MAG: DUF2171 domain-containing protein [Pseudopedobacter sp.]|nr:DUF2171 domain-containing protein [Deinococcales bacterium]
MDFKNQIQEHMEVICADGKHHGLVDHLEGEYIKLTKNSSSDGMHHWLPLSAIDHVDAHVHLRLNHEQTHMQMLDQDPNMEAVTPNMSSM